MHKTPTPPKGGCYTSTYPSKQWKEVPCTTPPDQPYPPAAGVHRGSSGPGSNNAAVSSGPISTAVGFFDRATATISETGAKGANSFSLQINTEPFDTPRCAPPGAQGCKGWQQFIFSNGEGHGFIQYWLIGYFDDRPDCAPGLACCPSGWKTFKPGAGDIGQPGCWRNSANSVSIPRVTLTGTALMDLQLMGRATATTDTVSVATDAAHLYAVSGQDNVLGLAGQWHSAEFDIFGDCCAAQANFGDGATIDVRIDVGGEATCKATSFTGETNSLSKVAPCCTYTIAGRGGGIMFTESNIAGAKSRCEGGAQCLPPGSACAINGTGCCAIAGVHECRGGQCLPVIPPSSCGGKRRPTEACAAGWHCCDKWTCGECR
jgi:hypothetical protein